MSLAKLKAAGIAREQILAYGQDWAPLFFQQVAGYFNWHAYAAFQRLANLQEQLEEDATAALLKW